MANLKVKTKEFEFFVNGEFVAVAKGWDEFENKKVEIIGNLCKQDYYFLKSSTGYAIYANYKTCKSAFIAWREWFGFRDKNGNRIYRGDSLINKHGESVSINEHWDREGEYYYRIEHKNSWCHTDIEIENKKFIKEEGIEIKQKNFKLD